MCIVFNNKVWNRSQKQYGRVGGELLLCEHATIPQKKASKKNKQSRRGVKTYGAIGGSVNIKNVVTN